MKFNQKPDILLSTFFFIGYFPLIPGTIASLVACVIFYLSASFSGLNYILSLLFLIIGFLSCRNIEGLFAKKDPQQVVIDEVSGMFLALLFLPYYNLKVIALAFLLFRIFDIIKPFPVCIFEKNKGALGIMLDDLIAALYANIILQVVLRGILAIAS